MNFSFDLKRKTVDSQDLYQKGVYPPEFNDEFKAAIRKRDNYKCSVCAKSERQIGHKLDIHHLNYTKYTVRVNCIALCRDCHTLVHASKDYGYRREWAQRLYKLTCEREGLKTTEQLREAWRKPDAHSP